MPWEEFKQLLAGISPDTPLGRMVSIRSETDKNVLKHFTNEQRRIRSEWQRRRARNIKQENMQQVLESFKKMFMDMAGR